MGFPGRSGGPGGEAKEVSRVVDMTDTAGAITRRLVELCPTGKLFRNSRGRAWTTDAVSNVFRRIQVRIGQRVMRDRGAEVSPEEIQQRRPPLSLTCPLINVIVLMLCRVFTPPGVPTVP